MRQLILNQIKFLLAVFRMKECEFKINIDLRPREI